ncbi:MAG TPA: putative lipid II flippase FtsW [bacterium]|nr:putative lipid II flippase FtsW [bacterium]
MRNGDKSTSSHPDFFLCALTLVLVMTGLIMIYSASAILAHDRYGNSYYFFMRQLIWVMVGSLGMYVASKVDLESLRALAIPALFVGLFLMTLVCIPGIGRTVGGAQRWFRLGPLSFQPSEIMKIILVFYLADSLERRKQTLVNFSGLMPYLVLLGITMVLLEKQHDFGTAVLLALVTILLLFLAGIQWTYFLVPLSVLIPVFIFLVESASYRMKRITAFLNPWDDPQGAGFQLIQSLIAVGNGGPLGVGLSNSSQKLFYLPAPHTDFIFAIIAEELGLVGAGTIVFLFLVFILRGFKVASQASQRENGLFLGLLASGITGLIGFQALVNLGVVTGLLPTKGIPLPLISYGGSSMVFTLVSLGVLFNISRGLRLPTSVAPTASFAGFESAG